MKAYYLDKNSEFNKLSLENAIRAYESIGNKQNAEKVQKILKELNRGS
jgi:PHD/YefM family antitoxin component YafN of YafNO toxin-antitoxin module